MKITDIRKRAKSIKRGYQPTHPMPWTAEGESLNEQSFELSSAVDISLEGFDQILLRAQIDTDKKDLLWAREQFSEVLKIAKESDRNEIQFAQSSLELIDDLVQIIDSQSGSS